MEKRFVSIWFRYLATDWFTITNPELKNVPFVLRTNTHGRMVVSNLNSVAESKGLNKGMVLADARAVVPELVVNDDLSDLPEKLLTRVAEWCIRFSPIVSVDLPDGILIDASGCTHLWGGDEKYINDITKKLNQRGYHVSVAIADTYGMAWGVARYGKFEKVVPKEKLLDAIQKLPPEALRIQADPIWRMHRLGLHRIGQVLNIPRQSLRKRFGAHFLFRLDQALGYEMEVVNPVTPVELYQERLPCMEPIISATAIEIALTELLTALCFRLQQNQMGLRIAIFKAYRMDGKVEQVSISTSSASYHVSHILKLFSIKISSIDPGMGIELFVLEASKVEEHLPLQENIWESSGGLQDVKLMELIDRIANRVGQDKIKRFVPQQHYWPERSFSKSQTLAENIGTSWPEKIRPLQILSAPQRIEVSAPIPDYPPMLFRYKDKVHKIVRADGPERIEQEWWIEQGQHRDYYYVEDEEAHRYWIFRLGHYDDKVFHWFIHGFFP